jgi:hypothetical protein
MFSKVGVTNIESEQGLQLAFQDETITFPGSGAMLVKLKTGKIIIGVHLPLDFKREGRDNPSYRTVCSLIKILGKYPVTYAIGDMNTIEGNIFNSVRLALSP